MIFFTTRIKVWVSLSFCVRIFWVLKSIESASEDQQDQEKDSNREHKALLNIGSRRRSKLWKIPRDDSPSKYDDWCNITERTRSFTQCAAMKSSKIKAKIRIFFCFISKYTIHEQMSTANRVMNNDVYGRFHLNGCYDEAWWPILPKLYCYNILCHQKRGK